MSDRCGGNCGMCSFGGCNDIIWIIILILIFCNCSGGNNCGC